MPSPNTLALRNQIALIKTARKVYTPSVWSMVKAQSPKPPSKRDKHRAEVKARK